MKDLGERELVVVQQGRRLKLLGFLVCALIAILYFQFVYNCERSLGLANPEVNCLMAQDMIVAASGLFAEDEKGSGKDVNVSRLIADKGLWVLEETQGRGVGFFSLYGGYKLFLFHAKNQDKAKLLIKVVRTSHEELQNSYTWKAFSHLKVGDEVLFTSAVINEVQTLIPTPVIR